MNRIVVLFFTIILSFKIPSASLSSTRRKKQRRRQNEAFQFFTWSWPPSEENFSTARPLCFSSVCMWRNVRSLCRIAFRVVMYGALISSGCSHQLTNFLGKFFWSQFGWELYLRQTEPFALGHRTSVFSVHPADPPLLSDPFPVKRCDYGHCYLN